MALRFEWHDRKAASNIRKHGITFDEASTIFGDPLASTILDERNFSGEVRLVTLGMSFRGRLLVVVHLEEESRIRIISARRATRSERRDYENDQDFT